MTAANDFPWTDEHVVRLRHLVAENLSSGTIAADLGCSRNAVIGKLRRLKLQLGSAKSPGRPKNKAKLPTRPFNPSFIFGKGEAVQVRPPSTPLSPDQKEYILGQGVPISELGPEDCQWPINERTGWDDHLFCANKVADLIDGKPADLIPYCPHHCRMAYQPASGCRRKEYSRRSDERAS